MRAQDRKPAARAGVAQANVLPGTHGHPLAIGAKGDRTESPSCHFARTAISLPVVASHNRLVPASAVRARGGNPAAVRVVRHDGVTIQVGWGDFCPEKGEFSARRRVPEADGLVVAAGSDLLAVGTVRHGCRRSRVTAEDGLEPAGGHVVQVHLVVLNAADRDLPARRAQDERSIFPPGTGSTREAPSSWLWRYCHSQLRCSSGASSRALRAASLF